MVDKQDSHVVSGVISSITAQKKTKDRVNIFVDGEFAFGLHTDVLVARGLNKGQVLSEQDVIELLDEDEFYRARFKAFHLLSYRTRTRFEMSQRLSRAGFSGASIAKVIDRLCELGMIDDQTFAREFTEARVRAKGYGPLRLRSELSKKGIDAELIEEAISTAYTTENPDVLALRAAKKYLPKLAREVDPFKRRNKLTAFLSRRGFTFDQMSLAIDALKILDENTE